MPTKNRDYWQRVRARAAALGSDGCTKVPDLYVDCCYEHDVHVRTGLTLHGQAMTKADADARFRQCLQQHSPLGVLSPLSWWRWAGVRVYGWLQQRRAGTSRATLDRIMLAATESRDAVTRPPSTPETPETPESLT